MNIQKRTWDIVEVAQEGDKVSRIFDISILILIFLNVVGMIIGTMQSIQARWGFYLNLFEIVSVIIFTLEYLARIWSCVADPRFRKPIKGRILQSIQIMTIFDLLAILPFYLPFLGFDLRSLRIVRLVRILRIAKVGRYYSSLNLIILVIKKKKEELLLTSAIMLFLLVMSSSVIFFCENKTQPDAFSSIPATMWWSVATLTTVGYGDMFPMTILGKFCASFIAILGVGMFALPTGILGAGFVEAIEKNKSQEEKCPHCGKIIP